MAGPLRPEYADEVHRVMSRGIEGRRICLDDSDRDICNLTHRCHDRKFLLSSLVIRPGEGGSWLVREAEEAC